MIGLPTFSRWIGTHRARIWLATGAGGHAVRV